MRKKDKRLSEKKYSNYVAVTSTPMEVFLSFRLLSPETPTIENAEHVVTITLPPPIALSLINAMKESVGKQVKLLKKKLKKERKK